MSQSSNAVNLDKVRADELDSIRRRRAQVELPDGELSTEPGKRTDLVGLAFSGGGLRSACFCLGAAQAFFETGFWRFVDYLSTVSGGGYIGSYLSSYVLRNEEPIRRENSPILPQAERGMRQPPDVQRFIYGGRYLVKPWEIANKYLVGLFFINVAVFSGLLIVCAAVAFLWRLFDLDALRDRVSLLGVDGLSGDAASPFWPFFVFAICWLVAWVISYWRQGAEAPGRSARSFLFLVASSLLIGMAILYGNGDADLSFLTSETSNEMWKPGNSLWATIGGLTIGGLLPFLSPKRLIQSGLNPRKDWERWVFGFATTAALVGVPLLLIGYFARENISGFNLDSNRPFMRGDFKNLGTVEEMLWPRGDEAQKLRTVTTNASPQSRSVSAKAGANATEKEIASKMMRDLYFGKTDFLGPYTSSHNPQLSEVEEFQADLQAALSGDEAKRIQQFQELLDDNHLGTSDFGVDSNDNLEPLDAVGRFKLLIAMQEIGRTLDEKSNQFLGKDRYESFIRYFTHRASNASLAIQHLLGIDNPDNDASEINFLRRYDRRLQSHFAAVFNREVASHDTLVPDDYSKLSDKEQEEWRQAIGLANALLLCRSAAASADTSKEPRAKRRQDLVALANQQSLDQWTPQQVFELNTLLLEDQFPETFRPRSEAQRRTTQREDQKARLAWICGALLVFLLFGIWVDLNATSMHRFYRSCLAQAFIVPQRNKNESPALSELRTTQFGAPYHLLTAATGLVLDHTGNEALPAGGLYPPGQEPDYRSVDSFVFSHLYCGSQITGYAKTDEYEKWIHGENNRIDLAEATAISGAAVSPGQIHNWLVAFLMFILNLRLGQWIPNPRCGNPRWRPTVLTLLSNLRRNVRDREYCFVTDGGNSENLGLVQLLRRRCSLIVQIDAGHDPNHSFTDLGRAIRTARIHGGIRLVSLDDPNQEFSTESLQLRKLDPDWIEGKEGGRNCAEHYAMAKILYPDGCTGLLIYVKPSFTGDESSDLKQYRKQMPSFPHEPTSNQVYEKEQVESYRQLGYHIGTMLCRALPKLEYDISLWDAGRRINTRALCDAFEQEWHRVVERCREKAADEDTKPAEPTNAAPAAAPSVDIKPAEPVAPAVDAVSVATSQRAISQTASDRPWPQSPAAVAPVDTLCDQLEHQAEATARLKAARELLKAREASDRLLQEHPRALKLLLFALRNDPNADVRIEVIGVLSEIAPYQDDVRRELSHCAKKDPVSRVRQRAKQTLDRVHLQRRKKK